MKDFLRYHGWHLISNLLPVLLIVSLFFLLLSLINVDYNENGKQTHKQDQYVLTQKVQSNVDDEVPTIVIDVEGDYSSIEKMNDETQETIKKMWQRGYKLADSKTTQLKYSRLVKSLTFERTNRSD